MAFTSRAERNTLAKEFASTPATVGPGSYGAYFNQVSCLAVLPDNPLHLVALPPLLLPRE